MPLAITWLTAFLDAPAAAHDAQVRFWSAVADASLSARRGGTGEFATLLPRGGGDPHLRVQRLTDGAPRVHLDVHVPDPEAAVGPAVALGAVPVGRDDGVRVMRSPGGLPWCLVASGESRRTPPVGARGHRSLVDQVSLDVAPAAYDAEETFWSRLTGWRLQDAADEWGLRALDRPRHLPLRILLQRRDEPAGPARAHLDLAAEDRAAEVTRHEALGAAVVRRTPWWTTLRDPAGLDYCVTDRDPATGLLG